MPIGRLAVLAAVMLAAGCCGLKSVCGHRTAGEPLARGMDRKEVRRCWGWPDRKERRRKDGVKVETWYYRQRFRWDDGMQHSALWDMRIDVKETTFTNGVLDAWRVYGRE